MSAIVQRMFTMGIVFGSFVTIGNLSWSTLFFLACALCVAFLFALYKYQDNLLFQPRIYPQFATPEMNPPMYRNPGEHGLPYEDVYITTPDHLRLHAWFVRPDNITERKQRPTLLFFHANAGNMGFRLENITQMYKRFHVNVFILSYRGYGNSEGTPTEPGILIDAETAWSYVTGRSDVDTTRILIFGRSLGGAVAIALASQHPSEISGLIVENTFTCISEMVDSLFPFLKWAKPYILKLNLPSKQRIATLTHPILFLSGLLDEVVPAHHMRDLYNAATQSRDRRIETFEKGMHNTTWQEGGEQYATSFAKFITSCIATPTQPAHPTFKVDATALSSPSKDTPTTASVAQPSAPSSTSTSTSTSASTSTSTSSPTSTSPQEFPNVPDTELTQ